MHHSSLLVFSVHIGRVQPFHGSLSICSSFVLTGKEWSAAEEFSEDAPHRPNVHGEAVEAVRGQHKLRRPVPTGHNVLMVVDHGVGGRGGGEVGVRVVKSSVVSSLVVVNLAM